MRVILVLLMAISSQCALLPGYCKYDYKLMALQCTRGYMMDLEQVVESLPNDVLHINIQRVIVRTIPRALHKLQGLKTLRCSECRIHEIMSGALMFLKDLEVLSLDHNRIHKLSAGLFSTAQYLKTLSLAFNHIDALPKNVFADLPNLKQLDLSHNRLRYLDASIFQGLHQLEFLDLGFNEVEHLNPQIFNSLSSVQNIVVHSNLLRTLSDDMFDNLKSLSHVSLEENPWECNCGLKWLWHILNGTKNSYSLKHQNMIKCSSPSELHSLPLRDIGMERLECTSPGIVSNNYSVNVLFHSDITLRCVAYGNPPPTIIWSTPRCEYLTTKNNPWWINGQYANYSYNDVRYILPYYSLTNMTVLKNGDLYLQNMHGVWTGEYRCIAINPAGIDEISFNVSMVNPLRGVFLFNNVVAAMSVGVTLFFGIAICIAHHITRPKCLMTDTKSISVKSGSPHLSLTSYITPKVSPFLNRFKSSSGPSEEDIDLMSADDEDEITDTDDTCKGEKSSHGIRETFEDVKVRLRQGKAQLDERLRERRLIMRSQLQSIKESGSQYLQTIRDSSSKTASQIRIGVATGVEHMKYHVRSLKEFCGTGDIGQTISTVTISTNVDTAEQVEIVKSVTLV